MNSKHSLYIILKYVIDIQEKNANIYIYSQFYVKMNFYSPNPLLVWNEIFIFLVIFKILRIWLYPLKCLKNVSELYFI